MLMFDFSLSVHRDRDEASYEEASEKRVESSEVKGHWN